MAEQISLLVKKTLRNAVTKQVKNPKLLLFSLSLMIVFGITAFLLKTNLDLSVETEKDLGKSFGSTANSFLAFIIVPFVLWIYLKDLLVYLFEKQINWINNYRIGRINEEEREKLKEYNAKKTSKSIYFTVRKFLLNVHCIGCLTLCGFVILHMISLFEDHSGPNFFFAWLAISYGVYLSITGLILRVKWWRSAPLMKKAKRISRGIHRQVIIAILALLALNIHLNWVG